ncbi:MULTISPECIES: ribbon-helix-helix domain-containing protein [Corallococcus]|uniref:Ribbon-helix-helix domain-containing protein n=1 Tax=Corallococcus carmarthensis TaxID=2316728 RepID=A0A3A8KS46_9BACT|nr:MULTISPECIES: ribbon-helix-helix domain-containing protein [Corallococcus]MBN8467470.1 ribbon-helix-helix domain-containing protein [Corallococcus exiguus]NOK22923.1 ribbon-helix-helix domain-containing protein [Corallococcus carmarthensis]RKH07071.1 ribbon-helix-helix domain-containing protein [Corallococcus carmarthensis]
MQDGSASPLSPDAPSSPSAVEPGEVRSPEADIVSTHVLVPEEQVHKLRELARRTRIHQSEYLREAVEDLLSKYGRIPAKTEGES